MRIGRLAEMFRRGFSWWGFGVANDDALGALREFGRELTAKFRQLGDAQPEDQLKTPVDRLVTELGGQLKQTVVVNTESRVADIGRPDIAISTQGLLCGYIELKAPGVGAEVRRFTGRNRDQWNKFKALPNLIYTDGNDWVLYRDGAAVLRASLTGSVTEDSGATIAGTDAAALTRLLHDFFSWQPIVPTNPRKLAELLAPLCRLIRSDVLEALPVEGSAMSSLKAEWRSYLFPEADDEQFADAYAQTLTYALLLARLSGADLTQPLGADRKLRQRHRLLGEVLSILTQTRARDEIALGIDLLERTIAAVDPTALGKSHDPWLYFYEHFLAAYDPKLRDERGVYYTPVEVVKAQIALVGDLLTDKLGKPLGFANEGVVVLDPATGTGTYPLAAMQAGLDSVEAAYGTGERGGAATRMAENIHAFELLVGPYAVAHLRLSEQVELAGGHLPADGAHVYLTDTLESPNASPPGQLPLSAQSLVDEHERALRVKGSETPVLVCIGNPPYDREQRELDEVGPRRGGWIRFGEAGAPIEEAPLEDFLRPVREAGAGGHLKNVYNDYVYFWRWALWKVFETKTGPGIVSFITASSYLRGPGFAGMREQMRRTFDELWIIDLEGGSLGSRPTENVFATPSVPDRHHFSGRGGKDVIPLWRDADATEPNLTGGFLDLLSETFGEAVSAEDVFAYAFAVLGGTSYTERFSDELSIPGPRLPLTKDGELFRRGVGLGRRLIALHTYGERFGDALPGGRLGGTAKSRVGVAQTAEGYPEAADYNDVTRELHVGEGRFGPVEPAVWAYEVSGLRVVRSWLGYRMKVRAGRSSSPLDKIRPETWTPALSRELLELLWVLEATVGMEPELRVFLDEVVAGALFTAEELPTPTDEERAAPARRRGSGEVEQLGLIT